jgi:tetratricopeptide (TPR) repeat protein
MSPFEAARILYQNGELNESESILKALWAQSDCKDQESFTILCALFEVGVAKDPATIHRLLDSLISGEGQFHNIWENRTLSQQGSLFEWHGHLSFLIGEKSQAFDSLSRAASLGRDTSLLWYQLGTLFVDNGELDLGLRYAKRSLQLFKQLDLCFLKSEQEMIGAFGGRHPTGFVHDVEGYLGLLLKSTKLAKSHKSLKVVRELIVEMIHQFPEESRLPKIRLMIERNIVSGALQQPTISL